MQKIQDFRLLTSIEGLCLLALLSGEATCGYQVMKFIHSELGEVIAHTLVYRKLGLLVQHGYAEITKTEGRKIDYQITEKGKSWLKEKSKPIVAAYGLVKDLEAA